ncbi:hypothetical protein ABZ569_00670 [Streptomyces albus]
MLRPHLPTVQTPPATLPTVPAPAVPTHHAACTCVHAPTAPAAPARRPLPSVGAGAVAAVLLGGVVLTALVTAVAVSAVSVAVAAVVLRTLLGPGHHTRRHHR